MWAKQTKRKWGSVWAGDFSLSLSLSLSRCSRFLAHLWAKFKGLFYPFYRSFNSSFYLQKAFFRALCFFEIFKRFVCALLRPFCHFEPLQKGEKSKEFKIRFVYGYFAYAQYDKFGLLSKNDRQKPQFRTPKALFRSKFRDKIYKFYSFLWIATLALLARNDGKAKIQIFHSKFKAFCKFKSFDKFKAFYKFNSFHKFISNFKPYTRLFHIFTPNFRAVFTDKFNRKEELWQQLAQKAGQEQSRRLKATENAAKPTK